MSMLVFLLSIIAGANLHYGIDKESSINFFTGVVLALCALVIAMTLLPGLQ